MAKKKQTKKKTSSRKKKATAKKSPRKKAKKSRARKRTSKKASTSDVKSSQPTSAADFTDKEIESYLKTGKHRAILEAHFGEELYQELSGLSRRSRASTRQSGQRVLILPGILGSKLGTEGLLWNDTIWLDPIDVAAGNLTKLKLNGGDRNVKSLGVMLHAYLHAKLRLGFAGFDADFHHFDWRLSITKLGKQLADKIIEETGGPSTSRRKSISLVAHSMGGLVARRALQILSEKQERNDPEKSMIDRVNRLVMLGTPNFGSFAPAMVVQAVYPTVQKVAAIDLFHTAEELSNEVFSGLPGLIEMLPFPERFSSIDLFNQANWPDDRPKPTTATLRAAKRIHGKLFAGDERCVMIAGVNQKTVTSVRVDSDNSFEYMESNSGDGTVPLDFAILPHAKETYYVEKAHGKLPSSRVVLKAAIDILETGKTDKLPTTWERSRSRPKPISRSQLDATPFKGRTGQEVLGHEIRGILDEFAAAPDKEAIKTSSAIPVYASSAEPINIGRQRQHHVSLKLANGDITNINARAAVLGVFQDVVPDGAARAFDDLLGGTVTEFVSRNMFSANVGEVFILPAGRRSFGPEFVVFAGLGRFDQFDSEVLKLVAENVARTLIRSQVDDFAFVPMGGSSGINISESVSSLTEGLFSGILEADDADRLSNITIVEYDEEKYRQLRSEVLRLATTSLFDEVEVTVKELPPLPTPLYPTARKRHGVIASGEEPIYLYVQQQSCFTVDSDIEVPNDREICFQVSLLGPTDTSTVVSETINFEQQELLNHLEKLEANNFDHSKVPDFGDALTEMVLPEEIISVLEELNSQPLVIIHDSEASRVPWETIRIGGEFVSLRQGISRKYAAQNLSIGKWLDNRLIEKQLNVLLIVNPTEDLPGTERESKAIEEYLKASQGIEYTPLFRSDANWNRVKAELSSGKYDVVHYAGHAFFDPVKRSNSGIICHGDKVLSGRDLIGLQHLPALAFFNACEAGRVRRVKSKTRSEKRKASQDRIERNIGLAEAFLRGGVANYVGTYWPVGDAPAANFAKAFYNDLLDGKTIGEAILAGRQLLNDGNDFGAAPTHDFADYIHYGNPHFILKTSKANDSI